MITIANANALHIPLADQSVQCVVTSPPYWGLRDYGTAKWEGGSAECDHSPANTPKRRGLTSSTLGGGKETTGHQREGYGVICARCGARLVDAQIGLESTPASYVAHIVAVMRECWRVLKDDGVLWLNLGDSYAANRGYQVPDGKYKDVGNSRGMKAIDTGLKPKDLCGIPWRVAFALQEDVWYLRSDIIWSKPNPMPESVTDRPTKAHEYVFLLTKRERYYYDAEAIKEGYAEGTLGRYERAANNPNGFRGQNELVNTGHWHKGANGNDNLSGQRSPSENGTRNRRSVWTIATQPYSGAHFATFPPALIEPMILAGTSARGECPHCGKAWVRVVDKQQTGDRLVDGSFKTSKASSRVNAPDSEVMSESSVFKTGLWNESITTGWRQQCSCPPHEPIPQTVLDPFAGSGTTGAVAVKHGRKAVLLDLNTKYIDLQFERNSKIQITMQM